MNGNLFLFLTSLCRYSSSSVLSGSTSSVTIVIRLSTWALIKFLDIESLRLFEVGAYSRWALIRGGRLYEVGRLI